MMAIRTGTTVTSEFDLKPGLNSMIAVMSAESVPAGSSPDMIAQLVAGYLGQAIGSTPQLVGKEPTGITNALIYVIGWGRPVHIHQIGITERRMQWYRALGAPLGDKVLFVAVSIDWRGPVTHISFPAGHTMIPGKPRVISNNWPDGDFAKQKELLTEAKTAQGLSEIAQNNQIAAENVGKYMAEVADYIVPDVLPGKSLNTIFWLGVAGAGIYAYIQLVKAQANRTSQRGGVPAKSR